MEVFRIILVGVLAILSFVNCWLWSKSEKGTVEELGYMVKSFSFTILIGLIEL
jgi:hypothetical protein